MVAKKNWKQLELKVRLLCAVSFLAMHLLPRKAQRLIGEIIALALHKKIRQKGIAQKNIERCFPGYSANQVQNLLKKNAVSKGVSIFDWGVGLFWSDKKIKTHVLHRVEGLEHLQCKNGRGVLLLMKHSQHMLLDGRILGIYSYIHHISRDLKTSRYLNDKYKKARSLGAKGGVIQPHEPIKLLRWLKGGKIVLYAPDHDYGLKHSENCMFFNAPAATVTAPFKLAKATNCRVCILNSYYDEQDCLVLTIRELAHLDRECQKRFLQQMNDAIAHDITQHPHEYHWEYKRFKSMNIY